MGKKEDFEMNDVQRKRKEMERYREFLEKKRIEALSMGPDAFLKMRVGCDLIETVHIFRTAFHPHTPYITSKLLGFYGYE